MVWLTYFRKNIFLIFFYIWLIQDKFLIFDTVSSVETSAQLAPRFQNTKRKEEKEK